jgi:toxin YoeB
MEQESIFIITLSEQAEKDIIFWDKNSSGNSKRIQRLLNDIEQTPYTGIGHPEQLKYKYSGKWSRHIDQKHRLVYMVNEQNKTITILSCKGHYEQH